MAAFLTLRCPLRCSYCIAAVPSTRLQLAELSGKEWVAALNRLSLTDDLPVTLQGGEPTQHPDFYEIVNGLNPTLRLDLLTNLQFDVEEFMRRISPDRFRRPAPYASIRISYHPECMEGQTLIMRVKQLKNAG
ncbi:MAG TPA: radical SAM protein, partial [bacterium]|nr:radical SAM protein [bacterium]